MEKSKNEVEKIKRQQIQDEKGMTWYTITRDTDMGFHYYTV